MYRCALAVTLTAVVLARTPNGAAAQRPQLISVHGVAFDSIRKAPLRDAFIAVIGTDRSTTSDAKGRFTIDSVPAGTYVFALQHPILDSLGLSGVTRRAEVRDGSANIDLAIPSFASLWRDAACEGRVPSDSGLVHGVVRDARTGSPVANATIELSWIDLVVNKDQLQEQRLTLRTSSDATGNYDDESVPLQYQRGGIRYRCGVLLIWTKWAFKAPHEVA